MVSYVMWSGALESPHHILSCNKTGIPHKYHTHIYPLLYINIDHIIIHHYRYIPFIQDIGDCEAEMLRNLGFNYHEAPLPNRVLVNWIERAIHPQRAAEGSVVGNNNSPLGSCPALPFGATGDATGDVYEMLLGSQIRNLPGVKSLDREFLYVNL